MWCVLKIAIQESRESIKALIFGCSTKNQASFGLGVPPEAQKKLLNRAGL